MDEDFKLLRLIAVPIMFTSFVGSLGSLSIVMRGGDPITPRVVAQAVFSSVAASAIVFLILYQNMGERLPTLVFGISALAGVGGATTLDLLLVALRRWSLSKGVIRAKDIKKE